MKRTRWIARYTTAAGRVLGWGFWANTPARAREIARRFGLGEPVVDQHGPAEAMSAADLVASEAPIARQAHGLAWLTHQALVSGRVPVALLTDDDTGMLHLWAHLLMGVEGVTRAAVVRAIRRVERLVPGYLPERRKR